MSPDIPQWHERDARCIGAHELPATLVDVALDRGLEAERLLLGTGMFLDDVLSGELFVRPEQVLTLINRTQQMVGPDAAFLAGHRLLPGHFGPISTAMINAVDLWEALTLIERHGHTLSPLLAPSLHLDGDWVALRWHDSYGAGDHLEFLTGMMMSAVQSATQWLSGQSLPWSFYVPAALAQRAGFEVNLGPNLHTQSYRRQMRIGREHLHPRWPKGCASAALIAKRQADARPAVPGFLYCVDEQLRALLPDNPSLEQLAQTLAMSPATLKRKLKKHRTNFQRQYDQVRRELAVQWLTHEQMSLEDIARRLHFHDARNLRRAFKRWTGLAPNHFSCQTAP